MSDLPEYRKVINERTFSQSWAASDFDPVYGYSRYSKAYHLLRGLIYVAAMAAIGVLLAWRG